MKLAELLRSLYTIIDFEFHYPDLKSPQYKDYRQNTTDKYGAITTGFLVAFLLFIPFANTLIRHGYFRGRSRHLFRRFSLWINRFIPRDQQGRTVTWVGFVLESIRIGAFKLYLHGSTIVHVFFWLFVLSVLSLSELHHGDLIFLAKRLGRIATVCLPTVLFLTLRPSPLPNTLYLALLPIHKWLSRLIVLQTVFHVILYCGFFYRNGTWEKAIKPENLYGWAAFSGFIMMTITSLLCFRNRFYKLFYFEHYTWSWIIVIALQFHVRPTKATIYTACNIAILCSQIAYRLRVSRTSQDSSEVQIIDVSPNMLVIEIPRKLIANAPTQPGAHIRCTDYHPNWLVRAFKQIVPNYHPYTLVSLPLDATQRLIVRKSNFKFREKRRYIFTGAFEPHLLFVSTKPKKGHDNFLLSRLQVNAKRVLVIIGGSAISFALPLLRTMNYHGVPTKVVWVIRDYRDISILRHFDGFIHGDDFEIFVTRSENDSNQNLVHHSFVYDEENEELPLLDQDEEAESGIEREDVNIEVGDMEATDEDEECTGLEITEHEDDDGESDRLSHEEHMLSADAPASLGRRTSYASTSEHFTPPLNHSASFSTRQAHSTYEETVKRLNIGNKIYEGRPTINHKYYNWCINEGFTQCSGPVKDGSNVVCCRDLPRAHVPITDRKDVWVISAGPKSLVNNVKVWANENGLNFHEEAFYV